MSSNLHKGSSGMSHQESPTYFQSVENGAFAGFDPALDPSGAAAAAGATGPEPQQWRYSHSTHPGLAQPPNAHAGQQHNHSALYSQDWHNTSLSNPLYPQDQDQFPSEFFGTTYPTGGDASTTLHQSHFSPKPGYSASVNTDGGFGSTFASATPPQGAEYSHPSNPIDHSQSSNNIPAANDDTIAPRVLQQMHEMQQGASQAAASHQPNLPLQDGQRIEQPSNVSLPLGKVSGNFLVTSAEDIEGVSKSKPLDKFVHISVVPIDVVVTKSTLPTYIPRKSRNEIARLLASDSNLKAQLKKKHTKTASGGISKPISVKPTAPAPKSAVPSAKHASPVDQSDDESEDDGDSSSSSDEEESIQPPLPATRPSKPAEAVKYDTVKALWRVPYRSALGDDIRKGLADFWEVAKTIRDRWKSDAAAVKQAEEAKKVYEIPLLKERVQNQRDLLETALRAAIAEGHNDIIEHLGENLPLMNALAVSLQDRARDADYNGGLSKAILEILSKCKTLTEGSLEKTGIAKILPRFVKRGDDSVKSSAKKITENATAASKKRREANKASAAASSQGKSIKPESTPVSQPVSPVVGNKRARESEVRNGQPVKKVASSANTGQAGPSNSPTGAAKKAQPSTEVKAGSTSTATAKKVITKPTNFFSSLQPAYKKPVTAAQRDASTNAKPSTSSVEKKQPLGSSHTSTTTGTSFSFAATMANLTKPKEAETAPKTEDNAIPETAEEKSKRLRKEQRRSLRVSFKPEGELVDVRYFEHDPEEDEGHYASQVRDIGDLGSEGRMFKLQHQGNGDPMDMDEEDDEEEEAMNESDGFESKEYSPPSLVDFSDVPETERSGNYVPYGGGSAEPESPEAATQAQHEANTLLAVYTQRSDIPPSPKEATESLEEFSSPKEFGTPPELVTTRLSNAEEANKGATSGSLPISTTELSALIGSLTQRPPPPPQSQPTSFQPVPDLEKIVAQFSMPTQHQAPPVAQSTQYYQSTPSLYNAPQQPPAQQQPNPYQPAPPSQQNSNPVDVSALLASLQGHMTSTQPNVSDILGSLTSLSQQQQQQAQPPQYPYEHEDRRRLREQSNIPDPGQQQQPQKGWQNTNKKPGRDAKGNPRMFVLPCKYFKEGRCTKGANCTYRHDIE